MVRVLKWAALVVGGILVLGVLAALILPSLVNLERYRNLLASRAGKALGREVTLGDLKVSLWQGIGAEAKGIQIAQAAGFGPEPFLTAEALRVRVQLFPLLRGQVKVSTAVLERPRIRLLHARDGHWSVEDLLRAHPTPSPPKPPAETPRLGKAPLLGGLLLSTVAVRHGEISLLEQTHPTPITLILTDLDLSLRQANLSDPIEVRLRARIGGGGSGGLEVSGHISTGDQEGPVLDTLLTLRDVEAGPWGALLWGGGSGTKLIGPLSAEVKLAGALTKAAFSGRLNLKPVAIQVGDTFQKAAGEEASVRFQGKREDPGITLSKLVIQLRGVTLDASLRIPDLHVPRVTFAATSAKVDLDRLLAKPGAKGAWLGPAAAMAAPSPSTAAGNKAAPPALAAQGHISIGDLRYNGLAWTAVEADLAYQDGLVQWPALRANFMNGRLAAKGEVDLRSKTPRVSLASRLDDVATEPLLQALALGPWTLRSGLTLESSLSFVGFSLPAILGSASGGGSLWLKNGRLLDYKPLDRLTEVIAPLLAGQGVRVRLNEFEQVSGHYTLDKGVLHTRDLTLTKAEGTVTAVGSLGLQDSSLNFDVVAQLGRTTVEAKVSGTTNKPIVVPKLGRIQRKIETEMEKILPGEQGKGLKDLLKGLFGK